MSKMNRMGNSKNAYQGEYKKVLCVCSAGLLRSPTAAVVLASDPFYCNTRAAGITDEYALVPVDDVLIHWADEIVCMEPEHERLIRERFNLRGGFNLEKPVICLDIPDEYYYRHPSLMKLIADRYREKNEPKVEQGPNSGR